MLLLVPINFSFWRVDYALEGSKFAACFTRKVMTRLLINSEFCFWSAGLTL